MSQKNSIGFCQTTSIMGYSLFPIGILAVLKIFVKLTYYI